MGRGHEINEEHETLAVLELFACIRSLLPYATPIEKVVVRSVAAKFATKFDFLSGVGASRFGGRWNRRGIAAIDASLDILTATQEAYQDFIHYRIPLSSIRPRVMAGARVTLTSTLDLTDSRLMKRLGFTTIALTDEDWRSIQQSGQESWTQAIGRGCFQAGFEGIVVPSARNRKGKNVVIFPENLTNNSKLEILSESDLWNNQ